MEQLIHAVRACTTSELWLAVQAIITLVADLKQLLGQRLAGRRMAGVAAVTLVLILGAWLFGWRSSPDQYTVARGDTLVALADRFCGDAGQWRRIHAANRERIPDPDIVRRGQALTIPC